MSRHERFGTAWVLFAVALALHVIDEATHDFLSVYNPNALMIRQRYHIPIPVFTFEAWIISLTAAILLLLCLSPLAFRGDRWQRRVAVPLAIVFGIFNASLHIASSIYFRRFMPGVYSSPILLIAAVLLLRAATTWRPQSQSATA
jgi:Protein of unknown function with HXXEE motif